MGLFKSKLERRIEWNLQLQKTLGMFTTQIRKLRKQEEGYIKSAREAARLGAEQQLGLAKKALKTTLAQRRRLEQQMLTLRIAAQMKEQAEAHAQFAKGLTAVSKAIASAFGSTDLTRAQKEFELAMARAQNMEQRVDLFLSSSSETMLGEAADPELAVNDDEIDRLVADEAAAAEADGARGTGADAEIDAGLEAIQKELGKEQ